MKKTLACDLIVGLSYIYYIGCQYGEIEHQQRVTGHLLLHLDSILSYNIFLVLGSGDPPI